VPRLGKPWFRSIIQLKPANFCTRQQQKTANLKIFSFAFPVALTTNFAANVYKIILESVATNQSAIWHTSVHGRWKDFFQGGKR